MLSKKGNKNILLGVFVGEESLPTAIGDVISSNQLDLVRSDLVLDLVHTNLSRSHISASCAKVLHSSQSQLTQVTILDARCDQRHGNIALNAVDTSPGRDQSHDSCDKVDQSVGGVVLCGVNLETVGSESRVLKVLPELVDIALHTNIRQIRHHVADDLVTSILCETECLGDGCDGVSSIGVSRNILVQRLYTNLESSAAVSQHVGEMGLQTIIGSGLDCDTNTFDVAHLTCLHGLVDIGGLVSAEVRSSRAIDADVSGVGDMRTSMGLAHDGNDSNTGGRSDRLGDKLWQDVLLVVLGNGGDDGGQRWDVHELVFLGELVS
ncbi:hypothetical protein HG531_009869 [Fusarium graminearum]|nr:hypothetical protein HG531_009869 [Fusarium graminearum]